MNVELETQVVERLRTVIDPETGADVIRMRLVEEIEADDTGRVRYTFHPSSPLCPLAVTLALNIKRAIAGVPGVSGQEIDVRGYVDAKGLSELLASF